MTKVFLQMGENDDFADANQCQKKIVTLCDNEGSNILHRLLSHSIRSSLFQFIRFVVAMAPALLNQRDNHGYIPLDFAVALTTTHEDLPTPDKMEEYRVIKLLVYCLEFYARDRVGDLRSVNENVLSHGDESEMTDEEEYEPYIDIAARRNVLQTACLLPQYCYTYRLICYLLDPRTSALEARDRSTHKPYINMAKEVDKNGNRALHLFVSNKCGSDDAYDEGTELGVIASLYEEDQFAILTVNGENTTPLQLAMQAGRRFAVTALVTFQPLVVFHDDVMIDPKLFAQLLNLVSQAHQHDNIFASVPRRIILTTLFLLLRDRPEIISQY